MTEAELLSRQSSRLAPFRERLLRRVLPAGRGATLDACCGHGALAADLAQRVCGPVFALDRDATSLRSIAPAALRVRGDVEELPFRDGAFDLVVTQWSWLWLEDPERAAREMRRVLAPDGALVAVGEPDFGGALEHPPELALARTWEEALRRAGADPRIGRRLPGLLRTAGFARVEAEIFGSLASPAEVADLRADEAAMLLALDLTAAERARVRAVSEAAARAPSDALVFVPVLGAIAWA